MDLFVRLVAGIAALGCVALIGVVFLGVWQVRQRSLTRTEKLLETMVVAITGVIGVVWWLIAMTAPIVSR